LSRTSGPKPVAEATSPSVVALCVTEAPTLILPSVCAKVVVAAQTRAEAIRIDSLNVRLQKRGITKRYLRERRGGNSPLVPADMTSNGPAYSLSVVAGFIPAARRVLEVACED
jgi:hypothetical protein